MLTCKDVAKAVAQAKEFNDSRSQSPVPLG